MSKIVKCGWCGKDTQRIYTLKDGKSLCPECAEKHYAIISNKLNKHIEEIKQGLTNRRKNITRLKQIMCKHEHVIDTGYAKIFAPNHYKEIYVCNDCCKEFYK